MNNIINGFFLFVLLLNIAVPCTAQSVANNETTENFNQWFMLAGEYRSHSKDKWAVYMEGHLRVANLGSAWQQWLLRPAVHYRPNSHLQLSLGYSWVKNFPYGEQPIAHAAPEHNVWQQVLLKHKLSRIPVYHRLRLEERFIGIEKIDSEEVWHLDHFNYANRFRYRVGGKIDGRGKLSTYFFSFFNEAFIDFKSSSAGYYWNQNWLYVGIGKKLNAKQVLQLGYQYQWIRKSDDIHRENNQIIQLSWKVFLENQPTKV